jgi:1,4-dihydroxy-2-naphthoyl-CoA synthase
MGSSEPGLTVAWALLCERAFRGDFKQRLPSGNYGPRIRASSRSMHYSVDPRCPRPVIAAANGYAIGRGNVMHVLCDFTTASTSARFDQKRAERSGVSAGAQAYAWA